LETKVGLRGVPIPRLVREVQAVQGKNLGPFCFGWRHRRSGIHTIAFIVSPIFDLLYHSRDNGDEIQFTFFQKKER
jgi:hypothetical protein